MDTKAFRTDLLIKRLSKLYRDHFSQDLLDLSAASPRKILVIAPHADDELIGCGAAIAYFAAQGVHITVLIVTQESSRSIAKSYDYIPEQRVEESYQVKAVLGYDDLIYFDFPELMLKHETDLQQQFCASLNTLITGLQPDHIFIPNKEEMHPDHQVIGKLTEQTIYNGLQEKRFDQLETMVVYEIWGPVVMNAFLEISQEAYAKKIEGIRCYKSQLASVDYEEIIRFIGTVRGKDVVNAGSYESDGKLAEGYKFYSSKEILSIESHV